MSRGDCGNLEATAGGFLAGAAAYPGLGGGFAARSGSVDAIDPTTWWVQMFAGQSRFLQQVLGGYGAMEGGFGEMLTGFLKSGNATFDQLAGSLAKMGANLLGTLSQQSGPLSGLAGSINPAMSFLSPMASILSTSLSLFKGIRNLFGGRRKQRLSSPLVNFNEYQVPDAASFTQSSRTVNVYINGQGLRSAVEVDRTLGRAGVDRSLRDQIKELVRSGANPAV